MPRLASCKLRFVFIILFLGAHSMRAQNWQTAMPGLNPHQTGYPTGYDVKFKNNLLGKDWIYGTWLDEDSVRRCVAYRQGGRWVPLPINFAYSSSAKDIEAFGDTLLIGGNFILPRLDNDTTKSFNTTSFLKWNSDSLWSDYRIFLVADIAVSNDSILIWGASYYDTTNIIYHQFMSTNGGQTWAYPYSIIHPTEQTADFGPFADLQVHNGQIYTVNNGSPPNDSTGWKGIVRWDGTQWHPYPYGMWGSWARATTLEFYKNELYMGGTFFTSDHPNNPGNGIAKWDGTQWTGMGGGVNGFVIDLFLHDSMLYSFISDSGFADAPISYFAGWDGHQWCGTPGNFARPPISFGFANDTLFCTFNEQSTNIGADTVTHMNYFVGDYVNGPNSVCSTYDLGQGELPLLAKYMLHVTPNPFSTTAVVDLGDDTYTMTIMDVTGRIVRQVNGATGNVVINREGMKAGIYFMSAVNSKGQARTAKFVVE